MIPEDFDKVAAMLVGKDEEYMRLYGEYKACLDRFDWVMEQLPQDDQLAVERYVAVSRKMEHRIAQLLATHYAVHGADIFKAEYL